MPLVHRPARHRAHARTLAVPEFDYVLSLDSTETDVTTRVNTQPETCAPTGTTRSVQNSILAAVANLRTDLAIQSVVKLDEYQTPLDFSQRGVTTVLDNSVLYLTGIIGATIVSRIVDGTALAFTSGQVTNLTNSGFTVALDGSLTNAGPFDALIEVSRSPNILSGTRLTPRTLAVPRRFAGHLRRPSHRGLVAPADLLVRRQRRA